MEIVIVDESAGMIEVGLRITDTQGREWIVSAIGRLQPPTSRWAKLCLHAEALLLADCVEPGPWVVYVPDEDSFPEVG
jgi:hypothetical protein